MAKIRKIKNPVLKKAAKEKSAASKAAKKAKRQTKSITVHVHIHIHVHISKKKSIRKKGDKQRTFFNKGQKAYQRRVYKFLQGLHEKSNAFIEFLKQLTSEELDQIEAIKNESEFVKFLKHLPKRKSIKYNAIVAKVGGNLILVRSYRKMVELRTNKGKLVTFYPVNNQKLYEFTEKRRVA